MPSTAPLDVQRLDPHTADTLGIPPGGVLLLRPDGKPAAVPALSLLRLYSVSAPSLLRGAA